MTQWGAHKPPQIVLLSQVTDGRRFRCRSGAASVAVRHVHTLAALKIMKADAHFRDMADPVRRSALTKGWVHLAPHAFVAPSQSELDLAA